MPRLELPTLGRLPNIKYVQIQTHSRCNADCLFCFSGDTMVITPEGDKPLRDLVGTAMLLVPSNNNGSPGNFGTWKEVEVRSFGEQPLMTLELHRGNAKKTVRVTAEHLWIVRQHKNQIDKITKTTDALQPGDRLMSCRLAYDYRGKSIINTEWIVHSVKKTKQIEEVFCAIVPDVECFTLADNLLTHNCPYIESEHHEHPGNMPDELWHHVLASLRPFSDGINSGKVAPYLMQEPLIDRTIFAKIADIYRCFPNTCVEVSTNGAALTDKIVDNLFLAFQGKRHDLWVSHHGIDEATLHHIMKIDYKRAHANLINLLRKSDGRFHIKIRGAGESRDGKHVIFTRQQYLDYWAKTFHDEKINPKNVHIDAFTFHDRAGTLHRADRGACDLKVGKVRDIGPGHAPFYCSRIDEWLHIMYDGAIRICCMDYHNEIKLPNIQDVWLPNYFHSEEYRKLVGSVSGMIESPDDFLCKRCLSPGG